MSNPYSTPSNTKLDRLGVTTANEKGFWIVMAAICWRAVWCGIVWGSCCAAVPRL